MSVGNNIKILIAPWGNPSAWREVIYRFDGDGCRGLLELPSRTSLKLLQKCIKPQKTLVVVSDTLLSLSYDFLPSHVDYRTLKYKEIVLDVVKRYVKSTAAFRNDFSEFSGEIEIFVAPGVGYFQNGEFEGNVFDFYPVVFKKLTDLFIELLDEKGMEDLTLEINFDATHGINFMTVFTYRATKEIAQILSIFRGAGIKKVMFKAYNSDPVDPRSVQKKSNINLIEEVEMAGMPPYEKFSSGSNAPVDFEEVEKKIEFKRNNGSLLEGPFVKEDSAFIGSLFNGLPLGIYSFYPDLDRIKAVLNASLRAYYENVRVSFENGSVRVLKTAKFRRDFKIYVLVYFLARLMKIACKNIERKEEVSLSELKEIKDKIFGYNQRVKSMIAKELNELEKKVRESQNRADVNKGWVAYAALFGYRESSRKEIDKRNFLAHAGLESNAIEIRLVNDEILLRYSKDKLGSDGKKTKLDKVKDYSIVGLVERGI